MSTLFVKESEIPSHRRIVCVGDSITDQGMYIAYMEAYFMRHRPELELEWIPLGLSSETSSGLSEPAHPGPRPWIHNRLEALLDETRPDWVVACYGMNDAIYHPFSEERFQAYKQGMEDLIRQIHEAGAKAIVLTPPPFDANSFAADKLAPEDAQSFSYMTPYRDYDRVLAAYAGWVLSGECPADAVIDIRTPLVRFLEMKRLTDPAYVSGDGIHPNAAGHWVMARTLLDRMFNISLERIPDEVAGPEASEASELLYRRFELVRALWKKRMGYACPGPAESLPVEEIRESIGRLEQELQPLLDAERRSRQKRTVVRNGQRADEFYLEGRECIVLKPELPAEGNPWIWRTEFLGAFDQADRELLRQGWHIAYIRLSNMYGCDYAIGLMKKFKDIVVKEYGWSPKAALFGFSRGGFYASRYAAQYPGDVSSLYLDAPVVRLTSWPGGLENGLGSPSEWEDCLALYGLTPDSADRLEPVSEAMLQKLPEAGVPVILVAGLADDVVPYEENGALLVRALEEGAAAGYPDAAGQLCVILKENAGHHPHSLEDPEPIVAFVKQAFA